MVRYVLKYTPVEKVDDLSEGDLFAAINDGFCITFLMVSEPGGARNWIIVEKFVVSADGQISYEIHSNRHPVYDIRPTRKDVKLQKITVERLG